MSVELFFDLGPPYAYLALARAEAVLGRPPGLPGDELAAAVRSDAVKRRLRALTDEAWARGVRGVPTFAAGTTLVYGDDRLEDVPRA